jgi:hypothetical protein
MDEQDARQLSGLGPIIFFTFLLLSILLVLCAKMRCKNQTVDEEAGLVRSRSKWPSKRGYLGLHGAMATDAMVHHGLGYGTLVGHGYHHGQRQGGHEGHRKHGGK